jgi:hypothetical protein
MKLLYCLHRSHSSAYTVRSLRTWATFSIDKTTVVSGNAVFDLDEVTVPVPDPGKGVCADPVNGAAILERGGPDPQGGNKELQLSPDKGRGQT